MHPGSRTTSEENAEILLGVHDRFLVQTSNSLAVSAGDATQRRRLLTMVGEIHRSRGTKHFPLAEA